jgi:signal transduction histidine kinase
LWTSGAGPVIEEACQEGTSDAEEDPGGYKPTVSVTIRDDGPGIPPGRLADAAADGRLGVSQAIRGRIRDLGGSACITSAPGAGTEIRLQVPRARQVT